MQIDSNDTSHVIDSVCVKSRAIVNCGALYISIRLISSKLIIDLHLSIFLSKHLNAVEFMRSGL